MLNKIWSKINENHFSGLFLVVAAILGYSVESMTSAFFQISAVKIFNVGLLLGAFFALIKVMRGTKRDLLKEIFDENSTAAAIFLTGILVALAISVTVNS